MVSADLTGSLLLRFPDFEDLRWEDLHALLDSTEELISAAEDLLKSAAKTKDVELELPRSRVKRLKFGSPGEVLFALAGPVGNLLSTLFEKLSYRRLKIRQMEADIRKAELAGDDLKLDILKKALALAKKAGDEAAYESVAEGVRAELVRAFGRPGDKKSMLQRGDPEDAILEHRLLPSALEIVVGDHPASVIRAGRSSGGRKRAGKRRRKSSRSATPPRHRQHPRRGRDHAS